MQALGIDLAAQSADTAACQLTVPGAAAEARVVPCDGSDEDLLAVMASADWVGIDAPFGWPADAVAAIAQYTRTSVWPHPQQRDRLGHRLTDPFVHTVVEDQQRRSLWPLSVSSDRIAVCAWRCADLLRAFHEQTGRQLDRIGVPLDDSPPGRTAHQTTLVEVYPAAALAL